jgi:hypothetical protein
MCLLVTLAACAQSGATPPRVLPLLSPSAPVTPAHTATAVPPRRQVVTVVRHYYAAANRLPRDMNAHALADLFTASCPCQAQVQAIRRAAERGEHYIDHARLNVLRPTVESSRRATVLVDLDAARGGLSRADGTRVTSAPPAHHVQRLFHLVRSHGQWLIDRIDAIT